MTNPPKAGGRGLKIQIAAVQKFAEKNNVPCAHDTSNLPKADIYVIAAYGEIIPKAIIERPKYGTLNIHPSLLPRHRGASPIAAAILAGDSVTGVTIMLTDEKMDHGPVLTQKEIAIVDSDTAASLTAKLADLASELISETIPRWVAGELKPQAQNHNIATFSKMFRKETGHIDWNEPADTLVRKIRAYNPYPYAWSSLINPTKQLRVNILEARATKEESSSFKPGAPKVQEGRLLIATTDKFIEIITIQPESRAPMPGQDFARGYIVTNSQFISATESL